MVPHRCIRGRRAMPIGQQSINPQNDDFQSCDSSRVVATYDHATSAGRMRARKGLQRKTGEQGRRKPDHLRVLFGANFAIATTVRPRACRLAFLCRHQVAERRSSSSSRIGEITMAKPPPPPAKQPPKRPTPGKPTVRQDSDVVGRSRPAFDSGYIVSSRVPPPPPPKADKKSK
jgi:hypothetical protein